MLRNFVKNLTNRRRFLLTLLAISSQATMPALAGRCTPLVVRRLIVLGSSNVAANDGTQLRSTEESSGIRIALPSQDLTASDPQAPLQLGPIAPFYFALRVPGEAIEQDLIDEVREMHARSRGIPAGAATLIVRNHPLPTPFLTDDSRTAFQAGAVDDPYPSGLGFNIPTGPINGLEIPRIRQISPSPRSTHIALLGLRNGEQLQPVSPAVQIGFMRHPGEVVHELARGGVNVVFTVASRPEVVYRVNQQQHWQDALTLEILNDLLSEFNADQLRRDIANQTIALARLDGHRFIRITQPVIENSRDQALLERGIGIFRRRNTANLASLVEIQWALNLLTQPHDSDAFLTTLEQWIAEVHSPEGIALFNHQRATTLQEARRRAFQLARSTLRKAHVYVGSGIKPNGWITPQEMQRRIFADEEAMRANHALILRIERAWGLLPRALVSHHHRRQEVAPERYGPAGEPDRVQIGLDPNKDNVIYHPTRGSERWYWEHTDV